MGSNWKARQVGRTRPGRAWGEGRSEGNCSGLRPLGDSLSPESPDRLDPRQTIVAPPTALFSLRPARVPALCWPLGGRLCCLGSPRSSSTAFLVPTWVPE